MLQNGAMTVIPPLEEDGEGKHVTYQANNKIIQFWNSHPDLTDEQKWEKWKSEHQPVGSTKEK